jgi:ABC-2 type transport system permease protein
MSMNTASVKDICRLSCSSRSILSKLITLPILLVVAGGLALIFHPSAAFVPWAIIAFLPALILAFLVRFLVEWTLALAAFWVTRVSAINQVYFLLMLFLAGQIAPLTLFPYWVQIVADILPFKWMLGFPVELLLGRLTPIQALEGLGAQTIWVIISLLLVRFVWRAGVRMYSAVGA